MLQDIENIVHKEHWFKHYLKCGPIGHKRSRLNEANDSLVYLLFTFFI